MILSCPLFKPQSKDTSYVWFVSFESLIWRVYRWITSRSLSVPVSYLSLCVTCRITADFSICCIVSCVVCVYRYFSASIRCSSWICVRSQSADVRHSRGSPYRRQWAYNYWVVPPFRGKDYRVRWLIQLSLHLASLCRSEQFEFCLKIMLEITGKVQNTPSII